MSVSQRYPFKLDLIINDKSLFSVGKLIIFNCGFISDLFYRQRFMSGKLHSINVLSLNHLKLCLHSTVPKNISTDLVTMEIICPSSNVSSSSFWAVYGNRTRHCSFTEKNPLNHVANGNYRRNKISGACSFKPMKYRDSK